MLPEGIQTVPRCSVLPKAFGSSDLIVERIWELASRRPDKIAIVADKYRLTFGELIGRASKLEEVLTASLKGECDSPIAVSTSDVSHLIVAALAAWKAGCPYLPISASGPMERIQHMLEESGVRVVVRSAGTCVPGGSWKEIVVDGFMTVTAQADLTAKILLSRADSAAYIIYTSGSTGQPKGVVVSHANLANLVDWYWEAFQVTEDDRGTQLAALTFDATVLETWPLLSKGAALFVPDNSISLSPEHLRDYLVENAITLCFISTSLAEQLMSLTWPKETKLRYLLTGGDALRRFPPPGLPFQIVNNYGPTECTVLASSGTVSAHGSQHGVPSIGQPINGVELFILDTELNPVPEGTMGEIYIGGAGVAAGYIGRPDLTEERFVANPFPKGGPRLYRTGDLGRKLCNGEFEFCGRIDDQIKIRGFRIEPGEIVAALRKHHAVNAAAVVASGKNVNKQLVAYIVLNSELTLDELRAHLSTHVPDYMVPDRYVRLDRLPLTPHGKLDRSALPEPTRDNLMEMSQLVAEPSNAIEENVLAILSNLLGGCKVGANDNFFGLGGNSLLAAQVIANVHRTFGVSLPLRSVFQSPTARGLSRDVERRIVELLNPVSDPLSQNSSV